MHFVERACATCSSSKACINHGAVTCCWVGGGGEKERCTKAGRGRHRHPGFGSLSSSVLGVTRNFSVVLLQSSTPLSPPA